MIHDALIGAGIGCTWVLVRDVCILFSPRKDLTKCDIFNIGTYAFTSAIFAVAGVAVGWLWQWGS